MTDVKQYCDPVVVTEEELELEQQLPPRYQVVLLDDDYTPMDFVVTVLERFFAMSKEKATRVMLEIHNGGRGICGEYPLEIAETKVSDVNQFSRQHEHPLLCTMENVSTD